MVGLQADILFEPMGQILRLIILAIGVWLVFRFVRDFLRRAATDARKHTPDKPGEMVACAKCGTFVPRQDAISSNGKFFCTREHAMKS